MTDEERREEQAYYDILADKAETWLGNHYCIKCNGSGWVPTTPLDGIKHYSLDSDMTKLCPKCGGEGYE